MTARSLLIRGMLVGVGAGLLAFGFGWLVGEGPIDAAVAFESAHAAPGVEQPELVSRAVQSTLGLGVAALVYGAAMGGIFGVVFAFVRGRVGTARPRVMAATLAIVVFVTVVLVPLLKYPPNPPAVGAEETVGRRSALYLLMISISIAAAVGSATLQGAVLPRLGTWNATLVAVAAYLLIVGVAAALLPRINEVPADFPATVLWRFRVASLGMQLVLWTTVGLLFGALTERAEELRATVPQPTATQ